MCRQKGEKKSLRNNFSLQRPVSIHEHLAKMYFIAFLKVLLLLDLYIFTNNFFICIVKYMDKILKIVESSTNFFFKIIQLHQMPIFKSFDTNKR